MKTYELVFLHKGKRLKKIIRAENFNTAQSIALKQKVQILELKESKNSSFFKLKNEKLILFFKEFTLLLNAGLSVQEALKELELCLEDKSLLKRLKLLEYNLNLGHKLSQAFEKSDFGLSLVELAFIKMSENIGNLSTALEQIILLRQKSLANQKRLNKALRYPILVFITLCFAFVFLILFVLPEFKELFESFKGELPWISVFLFGLYDFINEFYLLIFIVFLFAFFAFIYLYNKLENFAFFWDSFLLRLPFLSNFVIYNQKYYFFMILALLLKSGISSSNALSLSSLALKNRALKMSFERVINSFNQGLNLAEAFKKENVLDKIALSMLAVGMKSAKLEYVCEELALMYEEKQEFLRDKFLSFLEPLLTLFVGVLVLFLALGIFLPMWSLSSLANF